MTFEKWIKMTLDERMENLSRRLNYGLRKAQEGYRNGDDSKYNESRSIEFKLWILETHEGKPLQEGEPYCGHCHVVAPCEHLRRLMSMYGLVDGL